MYIYKDKHKGLQHMSKQISLNWVVTPLFIFFISETFYHLINKHILLLASQINMSCHIDNYIMNNFLE